MPERTALSTRSGRRWKRSSEATANRSSSEPRSDPLEALIISAPADIHAILFDAGNTLLFVNRERVFEIFAEVGVEGDEERFIRAELEARAQLTRRVEEGESGTEAYVWRDYFVTLFRGAGVPDELVERVGERLKEEHAREHLWDHVEPGTHDALRELSGAGYRLGVISNADGRVERVLGDVGIRPLVEFVVDSQVIGFEKPDPRIFLEGARLLEMEPSRCLYVGDLYPVDVLGARSVGMQAVLLDPSGRLDRPVDRLARVHELPGYLSERRAGDPAPELR